MDEALLERRGAVEDHEDGEAEPGRQAPLPGCPAARLERVVERGPLDPLHDDRGAPVHRAAPVHLGEAAEAGDGELVEVLLVKGARPCRGQLVLRPRAARGTHDLDRERLPVGVGRPDHLARGAPARGVPGDYEAGVAPERLLAGHRRRSGDEAVDPDEPSPGESAL